MIDARDARARDATPVMTDASAGFIRRALFKNLSLRHSPTIAFRLDDSLDRGDRIERVLRAIHEQPSHAPEDSEE